MHSVPLVAPTYDYDTSLWTDVMLKDASLVLDIEDERRIGGIVERVRSSFPGASVSVVEVASLD